MQGFYRFEDLRTGMRLQAEGDMQPDGTLRARTVSIKHDGELDEIEAFVEACDPEAGALRVLGMDFELGKGVEIRDLQRQPTDLSALAPGTRIKTKGHLTSDRRFRPAKIKIKAPSPDSQDEIEGTVTALDAASQSLTLLGIRVLCTQETVIEA